MRHTSESDIPGLVIFIILFSLYEPQLRVVLGAFHFEHIYPDFSFMFIIKSLLVTPWSSGNQFHIIVIIY